MSKFVKTFLKRQKDENKSATTAPSSANKSPADSGKLTAWMRHGSPGIKTAAETLASQQTSRSGPIGGYNDPIRGDDMSISTPSAGLMSSRANLGFKPDRFDPEKQKDLLDMGVTAIGICQTITDVLPKGVDSILQNVVKLLGVLKKMIENKEAWKKLILTIDDHQRVFNEQLVRMKKDDLVPDPESPLLAPVKQYADTLASLTAEIVSESGLILEDAPRGTAWEKVKTFAIAFLNVDKTRAEVQDYAEKLMVAMTQFQLMLEIFISFTVDAVKRGTDSIASELRLVGEDMKEMREKSVLSSEPKDTIHSRNISAFGTQHNTCMEGTRVEILEEIRAWASTKASGPCIYCIGDVAGTGKSTIAKTLAKEWYNDGILLAMFFFSQESTSVGTASDFCFSVADQIEEFDRSPDLKAYWESIYASRKNLASRDFDEQWSKLVLRPLSMLSQRGNLLLVIDAPDECTAPTRLPLLECLLKACSSVSLQHMRVLLTTRNEPDLLKLLRHSAFSNIILHRSLRNSTNSKADVTFYVNQRLDQSEIFTSSPEQRLLLIDRCDGLFIFAFLACNLLEDACSDDRPLEDILHEFTSLDALYHRTLSRADRSSKFTREPLRMILGIIIVAQEPLSISAIRDLLAPSVGSVDVAALVGRLGTILGSGSSEEPLYILHATFTEFLLRQNWVTTSGRKAINEYAVSRAQSNRMMARGCFFILMKDLSLDITKQGTGAVQYASLFWILHVIPELHRQDFCLSTEKFFQELLLSWIELGGLRINLGRYMLSLRQLRLALEKTRKLLGQWITDDHIKWCTDTLEFLRSNQTILQYSPALIHSTSVVFSDKGSLVYRQYGHRLRDSLPEMILGHSAASSDTLVITGHTRHVQCVAYSTSGDLLVSAAYGGEIIVWDAQTYAKLMVYQLEGAPGECFGIRFFPGNKIIISLWGGGLLYRVHREKKGSVWFPELLDGASGLKCIAWAPGWSDLLCGTSNGHIARFSCEAGTTKGESLKAHSGSISSLNFTSDGLVVASTSIDRTFKIWSIESGRFTGPGVTWHGPSAIHGGAFSPTNPSLFAFVNGTTLQIYNLVTGSIDFHCEVLGARAISYSPNGEYIAARGLSEQHTYILKRLSWDENEASVPIKLEPSHTNYVTCLLFSPDNKYLVSGSWDSTLNVNILSQVGPGTIQEGHHSRIISMAFTFNGKQLASVAEDGSLCTWDLAVQKLIAGPHQIGTHSLGAMALSSNHMTIACGSTTEDVEFWSMGPDSEVTVRSPFHLAGRLNICGMAFSPDDSNLAITFQVNSGPEGQLCIKRVEEIRGALAVMIPLRFNPYKQRLAYHPNGDHICCGDQAWDLGETPPALLSGDKLRMILDETLPVVIRFDDRASPLPAISLGSPTRQLLYIPPDLHVCISVTHDGLIALGSKNGRVTVIDFTRLVSQQESAVLSKINYMRLESTVRFGPCRVQELMSACSSSRRLTRFVQPIPTNEETDHAYSDPSTVLP